VVVQEGISNKLLLAREDREMTVRYMAAEEGNLELSQKLWEWLNPLMPNDLYMSRTAQLTSKRCILYIYSTNVGTEYFKHALYSPFFLFKMQFVS